MDVLLGIGDLAVDGRPGAMIRTLALGSCVALILHDLRSGAVGMAHIALPSSAVDPGKKLQKPGHFADSGVPRLVEEMRRAGWNGSVPSMNAKLAGGASILDPNATFAIGHKNVLAIRRELWRLGLGPIAEDVGGSISRSVSVECPSGAIVIRSPRLPEIRL